MKKSLILLLTLTFFMGFHVAHADITSGLIAHWTFDEGSGSTASDSSGNGNTMSLTNSPSWVTGKIGAFALQFTGASSMYGQTTGTLNAAVNNAITVSVWVNIPSNDSSFREVVRSGNNDWFFLQNSSDGFCFATSGLATEYACANPYSADSQWHMMTATFDGTTITVYKDGNSQLSYAGGSLTNASNIVSIAGIANGGGQFFTGSMDDVCIYTRELSSADVSDLFNSTTGCTVATPPTVFHAFKVMLGRAFKVILGRAFRVNSM